MSKIKTIVNVPGEDNSIIFYKNKWWLFCTHSTSGFSEELYIYYSENLFGNWEEHQGNPVKIDVSSSRPGGTLFTVNDILYRPAQDLSKTYGGKIIINQINVLNKKIFSEKPIKVLIPDKIDRFNKGIHTISKIGDYTLFDAKKKVISIKALIYIFLNKIIKI